jgi:two-component system, OmpR family, sensor histidine kinase VicK
MSQQRGARTEFGLIGQPPADIFDRIDSAVLVIDASRRVRYANSPAVALMGRPRSEILDSPIELLLPAGESFLGRTCAHTLADRVATTTFGWDPFLNTWIGVRAFPVASGIEAHVRTIPSTDTGPESIVKGSDVAAFSLDSLATPSQVVDADGVVRDVNQALLDLLGRSREEYVARRIDEVFLHPADAQELLVRTATTGELHDWEAELLAGDGQTRTVLITTGTRADDDFEGNAQWYLRDITAQRAADEHEGRLAALVDSSDDAIIAKRLDGTITSWNPGAERLYGYAAKEAIGQPITLIIPDDRVDDFSDIMTRLGQGQRIDHYETVRQAKDGRRLDVSISISPIRDRSGRIVGAATIARDISDRLVLERKQREFLEMVAHDLRSPLTSIKGFAQLMQRREAYLPAGINAILAQVQRMERLLGDVLDITRLDQRRQGLVITEADLTKIARSVISSANEFRGTGELHLNAPEEPLIGRWDKGRLAHVLDNLVSNALTYAPDGDITVRLDRNEDHVIIEVTDEGPGIEPEHLPHIFDRFYRTPDQHAKGRGVGLGLTIARGLVQEHGGKIEVHSVAGSGSTFRVTLPWAVPDRQEADETPRGDRVMADLHRGE